MKKGITVIGMINCDIPLYVLPDDLRKVEVVRVAPPKFEIGGDAVNVAMTLAMLGNEVSIIGRIGADPNGENVLKILKKNHIDTSFVIKAEEDVTSTSHHLLYADGSHNFIYYSTTVDHLSAKDIPENFYENSSVLYFGSALTFPQMDNGGIAEVFKKAKQFGVITAMDAALSGNESPEEGKRAFDQLQKAFEYTDIFFPSLSEAEYLTGERNPHKIAETFKETGVGLLGIKLGGKGCYVTDFYKEYLFSAYSGFRVVDTVGAGDSFFGGLLCAVQDNMNFVERIEFASAVAGFNIQKVGANAGIPPKAEVKKYIENNRLNVRVQEFI